MQNLAVTFSNQQGHALSGALDLPAGEPVAYALFAHCFTCSKNIKAATNIARALTDSSIAVLRFDFTGLGQSEGEFADTNFSSNVDDLLAAVDYLATEHRAPSILVGHSLGGTAVLEAAPDVPSAVAVCTIGSPSRPAHVLHLLSGSEEELRQRGQAEVNLGGRPFLMKRQFIEDLETKSPASAISSLRKALLIMHAPLDDVVDIDNASKLFVAACSGIKPGSSFIVLNKSAESSITRSTCPLRRASTCAVWSLKNMNSIFSSIGRSSKK